jgi:tRNA A37 threonylcarbamoyladenosine dehydratase
VLVDEQANANDSTNGRDEVNPDYDEELIREQLARNYAFFGEEGMERIRKGRVVIVGAGGVGSWAAVMLVRSYVL